MTDTPAFWGQHLLVDASGCDATVLHDNEVNAGGMRSFLKELVDAIGMKAYGDPVIAYFATHDPGKGGYTIMQMIETSSITGHFVTSTGEAYVDVFSCLEFDPAVALAVVEKWFRPRAYDWKVVARAAPRD